MLSTGYQLAAARALIGMDRATLAKLAKVGEDKIAAMEEASEAAIADPGRQLPAVQAALEAKGVEFLGEGRPGVRVKNPADGAAIEVEDLNSANDE